MTMQIAVDLDDAEHEAFGRWLASTAAAVTRTWTRERPSAR